MRAGILGVLTVLCIAAPSAAQTVRCELDVFHLSYGLAGSCVNDRDDAPAHEPSRTERSRYWPAGPVSVFLIAGPSGPFPWGGYFYQGTWNDPFQIDWEQLATNRRRLVLRTSGASMIVQEWRERTVDKVSLVFRLNYAAATTNDVVILESALKRISSLPGWDRNADQDCRNDDRQQTSLFCVLWAAVELQMGRYHHAQPAMDLVRTVIAERWRDRLSGHMLMDFNNHPSTTAADMRTALEAALAIARSEAALGK
jgi:hypothetical protein